MSRRRAEDITGGRVKHGMCRGGCRTEPCMPSIFISGPRPRLRLCGPKAGPRWIWEQRWLRRSTAWTERSTTPSCSARRLIITMLKWLTQTTQPSTRGPDAEEQAIRRPARRCPADGESQVCTTIPAQQLALAYRACPSAGGGTPAGLPLTTFPKRARGAWHRLLDEDF